MTYFVENLSKISKLALLFGISPCSLNRKSNKFECSANTLIYTFCYFLSISIPIGYIAIAYYLKDDIFFQSTFMLLSLMQQATVMIIFYSSMLDLMLNRQKHANFLNLLVELDSHLAKFYTNSNNPGNDLLALFKQNIFVVCFHATVCLTHSIIHRNRMQRFEHLWNAMQFFQTASLTLVGYYIRNLATILHHRCSPIFETLDSIGNDLRYANDNNNENRLSELMNSFDAFDEVMNLKKQLSSIYGIQLLLNSAFDFIMLTISVYGLLYFQIENFEILFYFIAYNLPHGIKCVLLVLSLDTLANQINGLRTSALKVSVPANRKLSDLMDLIFLKINHMEKDKYVTANDFYPVNRSMLYGMGAAIVTHMMIIFQFQQWEDSQRKSNPQNTSSYL